MVCCVAALAVMAALERLLRALRGGGSAGWSRRDTSSAETMFAPPARYAVPR